MQLAALKQKLDALAALGTSMWCASRYPSHGSLPTSLPTLHAYTAGLPSHASIWAQPNDAGVNASFKAVFGDEVRASSRAARRPASRLASCRASPRAARRHTSPRLVPRLVPRVSPPRGARHLVVEA